MHRPERSGFSLLELVVSLVLVALILTLSVGLLRESQAVFLDVQAAARQPIARLAEALIRADVQGARTAYRDPGSRSRIGTWTSGPMTLAVDELRDVRYHHESGKLVRTVASKEEGQSGRRTVLPAVVGWQWRELPGGVVEMRISHLRPRDPGSGSAFTRAARRRPDQRGEQILLRYAMRDRPGRRSW